MYSIYKLCIYIFVFFLKVMEVVCLELVIVNKALQIVVNQTDISIKKIYIYV